MMMKGRTMREKLSRANSSFSKKTSEMVNRPPPKFGSQSKDGESDMFSSKTSSSVRSTASSGSLRGAPKRGLEWSLRSLHSIDTGAQHFLSNYYETEEESTTDIRSDNPVVEEDDQTAYEIFKAKDERDSKKKAHDSIWAPAHAPLRTGVVDGKKIVFELQTDVTQKPVLSRKERLERSHVIVNANRSSWEVRGRLWLMQFGLTTLSSVYMLVFLSLNLVFATLFYFLAEDRCCGDSTMNFQQVFAFSIQTSTTIGYGSISPTSTGTVANFLVLMLAYLAMLINTIFAGLLFTKFVTPVINIQFSDVMTLCNVNGVPCLSFRIGNADRDLNPLTDINVRLTYSYRIPYNDHNGHEKFFQQTEELKLLSNRQHGLSEVWTLRHVLDEASPLFGLHFEEHPANKIYVFTLSIDAVQDLTKSSVNLQTEYGLEDILIGHEFQSLVSFDKEAKVATFDYSKLSDTEPYPVWYPALTGAYDTRGKTIIKQFKA
eukprot:scaffold2050_cov167-Amphora_coffeaeformis.AAC.11